MLNIYGLRVLGKRALGCCARWVDGWRPWLDATWPVLVVVAVDGGWVGCRVALSVIVNRVNYDVVGGSISTGRPSSPIANTPIFTDGAMEEGGEVCACE